MSAMKGITKACFSLQYESSMRRKCALCLRPYIPVPPYLWGVSYFYEIMIAFKFCFVVKSSTFRVLVRKSPAFTSTLIISRYKIIFMYACSTYSPEIVKEGRFWEFDLQGIQNLSEISFFSVSTINSMCAVLSSVTVRERLKM